jgi:hypothetical protein
MLMATASEVKSAEYDNDVGIVQQDYNYITDFSASVINIENPATVLTEYQLVNTQDLALAGLPTIIEATPCKDFNCDYNQCQTVAVEGKDYNENSLPNRWLSEMIYGNDTSAPTKTT